MARGAIPPIMDASMNETPAPPPELRRVTASLDPRPSAPPLPPPPPPPSPWPRRLRRLRLAALVLVLGAAALYGWRDGAHLRARAFAYQRWAGLSVAPVPAPLDAPRHGAGWFGEPLPAGLRRAAERGVYVWNTGKGLEIEMVHVPPGSFIMGSNDHHPFESPRHFCPMPRGYYIGRYETTVADYDAYVAAAPARWPSRAQNDARRHPMTLVDWPDARGFCAWAGLRLPTEREWEKAARGPDGRPYPWGHASPSDALLAWRDHPRLGNRSPAPVGSFPAGVSPYGAHDMAGNVNEWCEDVWDEHVYSFCARGESKEPPNYITHVVRGGSWREAAVYARTSDRFRQNTADGTIGFRPALDGVN